MRDPNSWEDHDEFKPERFLAASRSEREDEIREQALKYLPFGTAIGTMVQCFDWRIEGDKVNMEEALAGMNLAMAHLLKRTPVVRIDPSTFNLH
ncbi:unnamed protein product [Arabis nemorensis]|uniref:Uncharacterized protein n=1 Tax=Arabis nemorensis TaxID=586526 RepID=A0A565BDV7_9BRAS|nr:unnamed protein product [Arabis nemorensis]